MVSGCLAPLCLMAEWPALAAELAESSCTSRSMPCVQRLRIASESVVRLRRAARAGGRVRLRRAACPGGASGTSSYSAQDSRVLRLKSADRRLKTLRLSLMLHCVHIYIYIYVCGVHIILYYYICVVCGECVGLQTYIRECHLTTSRSLHDDGGSLAGLNSLPSKEFNTQTA